MVQCSTNLGCISQISQETAKILHRDISKTINDSNIDLNKFPANKVRQLAKKIESSKPTAKHIKQVASDLQAVQINLMCHQCTELQPSKFKRKQKKPFKSRQDNNKQYYNEEKQRKRVPHMHETYDNYQAHTSQGRCTKCGDSQHIEGFRCPASKHQCRNCHKYSHFSSLCYKKREEFEHKSLWSQDHPKHIDFRLAQFAHKIPYAASQKICPQAKILSACN